MLDRGYEPQTRHLVSMHPKVTPVCSCILSSDVVGNVALEFVVIFSEDNQEHAYQRELRNPNAYKF